MTLVSELMIVSGTSNDSGTYICRSSSELIASVEVNVLVGEDQAKDLWFYVVMEILVLQ